MMTMMKTKFTNGVSLESSTKKKLLSKANITVWLIPQSSMTLNSRLRKMKKDQTQTIETDFNSCVKNFCNVRS
jgi:hypothetical protein